MNLIINLHVDISFCHICIHIELFLRKQLYKLLDVANIWFQLWWLALLAGWLPVCNSNSKYLVILLYIWNRQCNNKVKFLWQANWVLPFINNKCSPNK